MPPTPLTGELVVELARLASHHGRDAPYDRVRAEGSRKSVLLTTPVDDISALCGTGTVAIGTRTQHYLLLSSGPTCLSISTVREVGESPFDESVDLMTMLASLGQPRHGTSVIFPGWVPLNLRQRGAPPPPETVPGRPTLWARTLLDPPDVPQLPGWISFWGASAAAALGFPYRAAHSRWLELARELPGNGWIVAITRAPYDGTRAEHRQALIDFLMDFPEIGFRVQR